MSTTTAPPVKNLTPATAATVGFPTVAAVYVRISSDPKGERAGVERQRTDCEVLAADLGVTEVRLYEDNDISAFSGAERPAFQQMLADVADGQVGTIVVWAVDRLYRRLTDLERIVTVLDGAGVSVHAVKSGDIDLSTADGRLHARLLGSVAQHESEKKSERIRRACRQRAENGRTVASNKPFGWRFIDGNGGGLEPDPTEAPALRQAYADILDGLSLYAAHKRLGTTVPIGKMTSSTLGLILRNPRNGGYATYKGEITGVAADGLRIVEPDVFDRVAAILNDPSRRTSPGRPVNTPLGGGLLRCGKCGGPMSASKRRSRDVSAKVYICSRNHCMTRRRALLDGPVLAMAADVLAELGARGLLAQAPADDTRAHELRTRIADAEQRLDALAAMVASGELSPVDFGKASTKIRTGMDTDSAALAARAQRPALVKLAAADDVRATWQNAVDSGDTAIIRSVLSEVADEIVCNPDRTATVHWAGWTGLEPTTVGAPGPTIEGRAARREQVAALHNKGLTISAIARELNTARQVVREDLKAMGLYR